MQSFSPSLKGLAVFIGTVTGISISGFVIGFMGSLVGAFILHGELAGFGDLAGAIAGMAIGYPGGVIVGLLVAKRHFITVAHS